MTIDIQGCQSVAMAPLSQGIHCGGWGKKLPGHRMDMVGTGSSRTPRGLSASRYAMKCLDKKRIKMKQGETLALNERIMLSLVSTGVRG